MKSSSGAMIQDCEVRRLIASNFFIAAGCFVRRKTEYQAGQICDEFIPLFFIPVV